MKDDVNYQVEEVSPGKIELKIYVGRFTDYMEGTDVYNFELNKWSIDRLITMLKEHQPKPKPKRKKPTK